MEKHEEAEKDYMNGMKYKDIAEKYGTTINTVKSWKKRYDWNKKEGAHKIEKGCTQNEKRVHTKNNVSKSRKTTLEDGTDETLENTDLTAKQQMFCIYYVRSFNATQSYMKAYECNYNTAMVNGSKALRVHKVKEEIERLKKIKKEQIQFDAEDLVELNMRIVFSDIGDYVSFYGTEVKFKNSEQVDTQMIQEVKKGKDGISIKLADKFKAMDFLTKYFAMNPMDKHKMEFDKRKLELEYLKLDISTSAGDTEDIEPDDNFMEMLNATAKEVWSDE